MAGTKAKQGFLIEAVLSCNGLEFRITVRIATIRPQ